GSTITELDYKNLNKNDIEDMYLLIMNGKFPDYAETGLLWSLSVFIRSSVIWKRVHDFQLRIESYQQKVNLTAPTISFPGVEKHKMFSIIYEPVHEIIYKNSKKKKRVMRHLEIHKFCDPTLNRVLEGLRSYNNDVNKIEVSKSDEKMGDVCESIERHGLGYPNPYTLKQAISQCPKLYLASSLGNSEISLNVRDTEDTLDDASKNFVPQKELSAKQKYFQSSFIPSDKNSNATPSILASMPKKLEDENASLDFTVQSLTKERDNVKLEYQKLFNSIKNTRSQTQTEMDELIAHVSEKTYAYGAIHAENQNLLFTISELKTRLANAEKGSTNRSEMILLTILSPNKFIYYLLSDMAVSSPVCLMSKSTSTKSRLWHRRLSHLNFGTINDLTRLDLVDGLPKFKYGKDHLYSACERGKSKKASHPLKLVPSEALQINASYGVYAVQCG
ncbi:zinc finger, CCHC-type containing protein, partial [Tanacetum coccineum]